MRRGLTLVIGLLLGATLAVHSLLLSTWSNAASVLAVDVVEPETGASFPEDMGAQGLVALGFRKKFGAVKVYAIGFYLDRGSKLWGKAVSSDELQIEGPGKTTLRLVVTSSLVTQEKLAKALRESVAPRVKGLAKEEVDKVMSTFSSAFLNGPALKRNTVLIFGLDKSGIKVEIGNNYKVEVNSAALTDALLATYLDNEAVLPVFRKAVLAGLANPP